MSNTREEPRGNERIEVSVPPSRLTRFVRMIARIVDQILSLKPHNESWK